MFGAENRTTVPIEVTLNVGLSQNFVCSTASHQIRKVIEPNQVEFLTHIRRDNLDEQLLLDYDFKFKVTH